MKSKTIPSAYENYEIIKLNRINRFNFSTLLFIKRGLFISFIIITLMLQIIISYAQTAPAPLISLVPFCTGLTTPTVIANCGDSRLFVGQKNGYIIVVNSSGTKLSPPFLNIDNLVGSTGNEQGLLGLCFHPNYASNGYFYVYYTDNNGNTKVSRFTRDATNPNLANAGSETTIFSLVQPFANHNGGCIQFGPDGYLYIGLGDGGGSNDPNGNGQNMQTLLGKMIRIDVNNGLPYTIPPSNPYVNHVSNLKEIWASGLRNPWRWSFDRLTGDMWIGEVGQGTWEEVDFQPAGIGGRNYGWRCYEGNHPFNTAGCAAQSSYVSPVSEYQHSSTNGCSITGGYVYRGGKYSKLFGHYLTADYCSGVIRDVTPDGNGGWVTTNLGTFSPYEFSTFGEDKNGEIYIAQMGSGNILKIKENSCLPTAFIKGAVSRTVCSGKTIKLESIYGAGNTYQWQKNNVNIVGATSHNYNSSTSGSYKVIVTNGSGCSNVSAAVNVTINPVPVATAIPSGPTTFCLGSSVVLVGNSGTGLTYQWKKYGNNIAGATAKNYTATKTGTYKLMVTSANGCTALSSAVLVNVNCKSGSQEDEAIEIRLSPNPSHGEFKLHINSGNRNQAKVEVTDIAGRSILRRELQLSEGINSCDVNLNYSPKGVYVVKVINGSQVKFEKIIID